MCESHRMAVSASFHRNILLLNQMVPPSDDFKKVFREGMFDKPNSAGFIYVSHYLLTICDAERFRKLIEWPIICKKSEAKYRNDITDYLNVVASENPDIGFPHILTSHLHHASGTKFTIIMWKLSRLAVKKYLTSQGECVMDAPKLGPATDLTKTYLQRCKANVTRDILNHRKDLIQTESAANIALMEEKEELDRTKTELFDSKQSVKKHAAAAPVEASIKEHLANVEDTEIIQMWRKSIDDNIGYIQKQNAVLKDFEKVCENVSGIILNLSSDADTLEVRQLEAIDCSRILELPFPPDIQQCLYHLYSDNNLRYRIFIHLFTLMLRQVHHYLGRTNFTMDLSQCVLQVEASVEDLKSVCNVFETFLTSIVSSTEEAQSALGERNAGYTPEDNALPFIKNVLLMPSPLIKINTHYVDEKNDLHKLLQFTPAEVTHKSLFSRYMRDNRSQAQDLRTNLFVSRINIDNAISLGYNEKQSLNARFVTPKRTRLCKKTTEKYSRLFSTCMNKHAQANYSLMSLPSSTKANSSAISAIGEISNLSDLNLDMTPRNIFSSTEELLTPVKRLRNNLPDTSAKEVKDKCDREFNVNKPDLDEFTEIQFSSKKNAIVKHEAVRKRRSIGDLVERYKKLLEASNSATAKIQIPITLDEVSLNVKLNTSEENERAFNPKMALIRRASHAGSWYSDNGSELSKQLEGWLSAADLSHGPARAIIAPHAGYSYCGACAGFAYRQISPVVVRRIFILGPSHHVRLPGCALTSASIYRTPLYDLHIDQQVRRELEETGHFECMDLNTDEEEHSIEMQLPFIAKVMEGFKDLFTIIPILVGSLSPEREALYGRLLAPYMADPQTLFVISSDFCHWGQRFRYTYYDRSCGPIHRSIQNLDKMGMDTIETLNPVMFTDYLKKYNNTICGRHPIGVLLQAIHSLKGNTNGQRMNLKFLKYAQSSQCNNANDSSVSYASASLVLE